MAGSDYNQTGMCGLYSIVSFCIERLCCTATGPDHGSLKLLPGCL